MYGRWWSNNRDASNRINRKLIMNIIYTNQLNSVYYSLEYPERRIMFKQIEDWLEHKKSETNLEEKISFLKYQLDIEEKPTFNNTNNSISYEIMLYRQSRKNYLKSRIEELQLLTKNKTK